MPLGSYIGQYGESLKRLSALAQPFNSVVGPQAMGGADPTGALPAPTMPGQFDRNAQAAQMSIDQSGQGPPAAGALPAAPAADPQGALSTTGAPPAPAAAGGSAPPISFGDIHNGASTADKEIALKNLEKHVDVNTEFSALEDHGIVPKDEKLSKHEKGMLVLEFGLRMMAESAQGQNAADAAGRAGMGLMESYRARKDAEARDAEHRTERSQDRADKRDERASVTQDRANENNSRQTISYQEQAAASRRNTADIQSREKIAKMETDANLKAAHERAVKENQPMHFIATDGTVKLVDAAGNVTTPMDETTDAKGKKTRTPLKAQQKADASGIDEDKTQALIEREKDRLAKDPATSKEMRVKKMDAASQDAYLEKQARRNILGRLPVGAKGSDPLNLGLD